MTLTEPGAGDVRGDQPAPLGGEPAQFEAGRGQNGGSSASISWAAGFRRRHFRCEFRSDRRRPAHRHSTGAPAPAARIFPADKHRARVGNRDQVRGGAFIKWRGAGARASDGPSGTRCRAKSALRPTPIVCQGNPRIQAEIPTRSDALSDSRAKAQDESASGGSAFHQCRGRLHRQPALLVQTRRSRVAQPHPDHAGFVGIQVVSAMAQSYPALAETKTALACAFGSAPSQETETLAKRA